MRISPNPVNQGGSVNLTLNETPAQERIITLYTVELYNSGKQIVYQKTINENTTQLNLSSLNKGKYNVVVKKNGIIHTTQLLTVI